MMVPVTDYAATLVMLTVALIVLLVAWLKWHKQKEITADYKKKYERELHHRKSSEVRLGKIGENLAPFTKSWPWNPKNFRFLGHPIDGVQFEKDGIVFVEIKTGGARLSKSQKDFRDLVNDGKVSFVTFKVTETGVKLIKED